MDHGFTDLADRAYQNNLVGGAVPIRIWLALAASAKLAAF